MSKKFLKRNRVIYQNEFLYTSFDATGYHFNTNTASDSDCSLRNIPKEDCSGNLVCLLHRIQSINYGITLNNVPVNQYGSAARINALVAESPDVTLDFEYFLADGFNEQTVGFIVDGEHQALTKHMIHEGRVGQNFFISVAPEGHDIIKANLEDEKDNIRVIGIGNAFLSQYAVTAQVGDIPRARLSFEAFNARAYHGFCNLPIPSVNPAKEHDCDSVRFSLPDTYESFLYGNVQGMEDIVYSEGNWGLRPADILISLGDGGLITKQSADLNNAFDGSAHVQGFSINVPLGSTKISRIGGLHSFARVHNYPVRIEVTVQAIVSELKKLRALHGTCANEKHDLILQLRDCNAVHAANCDLASSEISMTYVIKSAQLDAEGFTLDLDNSKIVDLTFTASMAGPEDKSQGLFIYGKSFLPDKPAIVAWGQSL